MAIRLEELIKDTQEFEMKLVAGSRGLDNVVRWIHMVESREISQFLEGNEIVFTTGIGISDEDELINLIKDIIYRGASAVVINTGPYIKTINSKIISYCDEEKFPLFIVPWRIKMPDIMRKFSTKILESEKINLEFSNAVKNALFFPDDEKIYLKVLERYGFLAIWSYTVVIIDIDNFEFDNDDLSYNKFIIFLQNMLIYYSSRICVFELNNLIVIVFAEYDDVKIREIIQSIIDGIKNKYSELNYYIGMGRSTRSAKCIYKSFENAKQIVTLNRKIGRNNQIITNEELGIYKLLLAIEDKNLLKEYNSNIIGELERYDLINKTDYINFLNVYVKCNCNSLETSKELFIHKNTVNYKVRKIEEILNCDLSKLEFKMKIYIALILKNII